MIIGISGKARAGKDTLGAYLQHNFAKIAGLVFYRLAFADELKKQVADHFGLTNDQLYGNMKEVEDIRYHKRADDGFWTPREILQAYGEFLRTVDYDYWVKVLFQRVEKENLENVIITDIRHINEAEAVLERRGVHIRIFRDTDELVHNSGHISETALDDYDRVTFKVINSGTLEDLEIVSQEIVKKILSGGL